MSAPLKAIESRLNNGYEYEGKLGELPGIERAKDDVRALLAEVAHLQKAAKYLVPSLPKPVVLAVRRPDDYNTFTVEGGEVEIIDVDLGAEFDYGYIDEDDRAVVEEHVASWSSKIAHLPEDSVVRAEVEKVAGDCLAEAGGSWDEFIASLKAAVADTLVEVTV